MIRHALAAKSEVMMAYPDSDIQTSAMASPPLWGSGLLLLLLIPILCGCSVWQQSLQTPDPGQEKPLLRREFSHLAMGTRFRIVVVGEPGNDLQMTARRAFDRIDQIEAVASDWNRDSEIRTLCRTAPHPQPVVISDDLARLLRHSLEIHKLSEGRFDISLGSLSRLWRRCFLAGRLPTEENLQRAIGMTGMNYIELEKTGARLTKAGISVDFGGIAKGYAVDQALEVMVQGGYPHTLVDGGGDLAFGPPHGDSGGWRITLPSGRRIFMEPGAIATSGDTEKFVEVDGDRYSHILDPNTGLGLRNSAVVTVFADSAMLADAWATACSVPGPWPLAGEPGSGGLPRAVERIPIGGETQYWGELPLLVDPQVQTGTGGEDSVSVPLSEPEGSGIPKIMKTERIST